MKTVADQYGVFSVVDSKIGFGEYCLHFVDFKICMRSFAAKQKQLFDDLVEKDHYVELPDLKSATLGVIRNEFVFEAICSIPVDGVTITGSKNSNYGASMHFTFKSAENARWFRDALL